MEGIGAVTAMGHAEFVGVDGTKGRWVAVALTPEGSFATAILAESLAEVVESFPDAKSVGIDVPIGLPQSHPGGPPLCGPRAADLEAKMLLGPRRATIFPVPPREVLTQGSYAEARAKAVELTGKSLSAQSFALRHNILEAEALVALLPHEVSDRIYEVHPELSFRALCGRVLLTSKRSWNGAGERRAALEEAGIVLPRFLGEAGDIPGDDVLDAAVAAWSAKRVAAGTAGCVPLEPSLDERGRKVAVWY